MPEDKGYVNLQGKMAEEFMKKHKMGEVIRGSFSGNITRMESRSSLGMVVGPGPGKKGKEKESKYCCVEIAIEKLQGDKEK